MHRRRPAPALLVCLGLAGLVGCGDPVADATYQGQPRDEIQVTVAFDSSDNFVDEVSPRATLVWFDEGGNLIEQGEEGIAVAETSPAALTVRVFDLPPPGIERAYDGITGLVAFGQVGIYDDQDGDHRWDRPDEGLIGLSDDLVVVYTTLGASGDTIGSFSPGFHHVTPAPCPAALRFSGPASGPGTIELTFKPFAFELACSAPASSYCAPFAMVRYRCRLYPNNDLCQECAAALFPQDASSEACDAWLTGCLATYPNDQKDCQGEHAICIDGEPACDRPCLCHHLKDDCLASFATDVCDAKYGDCTAP